VDDNEHGMDDGTDRDATRAEDAALVEAARTGDPDAFGALYERWFDRAYDLARRITRDEQAAADVAQDAFLSAWRGLDGLAEPGSFGGWLLRITRNRAFNAGRSTGRTRPVDTETMTMIERSQAEARVEQLDEPAQLAGDAELVALVWESVEALGDRDAEVLDLSLRHGLTPAEVAEVVGTNRNAANQMVHRARLRLGDAVRARVLWRGGEPQCGDLADVLRAAGATRFDAEAVRITTRHAENCTRCEERRRLRLEPAAMFAAVPMVGAPALLKQEVAHALAASGVPMGTGSGRTGSGDAGSGGASATPRRGRRAHRVRRALVLAAAVVVLAVVGVVLASESVDDHPAPSVRQAATTTSTLAPTTATPATTPAVAPATEPAAAPPATGAPPPLTPPPPSTVPVRVTIAVTPSSAPMTYVNDAAAPTLSWSTDGPAASVEVTGPGQLTSAQASGTTRVCPTASGATWSFCVGPANATYTIVARDGSGTIVATASATLTVG
jgi:RNA polymerase sigma factor (sigma-70 family)